MAAGYIKVKAIPRAAGASGAQGRTEGGQFTSEVTHGIEAANEEIAHQVEDLAMTMFLGTGLRWETSYHAVGGGTHWEIHGEGQWVDATEFGIPAHPISPNDPSGVLVNRPEGFGPILPPGRGVNWRPTKAIPHHILERAGDSASALALGIVIAHMP
jgi:hypothetical protein